MISKNKTLDETDRYYFDYILSIIKNNAYNIVSYIDTFADHNAEDIDPEKLKIKMNILQKSLEASIDELNVKYREIKEREGYNNGRN